MNLMIWAPIGAVLALIFVFYKGSKILKMDEGNKEVRGIGKKLGLELIAMVSIVFGMFILTWPIF